MAIEKRGTGSFFCRYGQDMLLGAQRSVPRWSWPFICLSAIYCLKVSKLHFNSGNACLQVRRRAVDSLDGTRHCTSIYYGVFTPTYLHQEWGQVEQPLAATLWLNFVSCTFGNCRRSGSKLNTKTAVRRDWNPGELVIRPCGFRMPISVTTLSDGPVTEIGRAAPFS